MQLRQHSTQPERASTSGYSLIEFVVVIVVLGIIGATASFVVLESMRVYARAQPRMEASYQVNLVADRVLRDVRDIPDSSSIQSFSDAELEFFASNGELISYSYADDTLLRNTHPLAEGLQGLAFSFESAVGIEATVPSDIHLVRLRLVAQSANETVPLGLTIFPRGLQR